MWTLCCVVCVAAIVDQSTRKIFNIAVGLDGWFIKCGQPGMSPASNALDAVVSVLMPGLLRLVALFYLFYWDGVVADYRRKVELGQKIHVPKEDNRTVVSSSGSSAISSSSDGRATTTAGAGDSSDDHTSMATRSARKAKKVA